MTNVTNCPIGELFTLLNFAPKSKNFLLRNIFVSDHWFGVKLRFKIISCMKWSYFISLFVVTLFPCSDFYFIALFVATLLPCLCFHFIYLLWKPVDLILMNIKVQRINYQFAPKPFKNCFGDIKDDTPLLRKKSFIKISFPGNDTQPQHSG
jgi:hypothetical protein